MKIGIKQTVRYIGITYLLLYLAWLLTENKAFFYVALALLLIEFIIRIVKWQTFKDDNWILFLIPIGMLTASIIILFS